MAVNPTTKAMVRWSELRTFRKFNRIVSNTISKPMKARPVLNFMISECLIAVLLLERLKEKEKSQSTSRFDFFVVIPSSVELL